MRSLVRLVLLAALVVPLAGCLVSKKSVSLDGTPMVTGSGPMKGEDRKVGSFDRVKVNSAISADIRAGDATSVRVFAQAEILPHIKTIVEDGKLTVQVDGTISTTGPVKVNIVTKSLKGLELSGASRASAEVKADGFDLDLDGASQATLKGSYGDLKAAAGGASTIDLKGTAKNGDFKLDGASTLDADSISFGIVKVECGGASHASIGDFKSAELHADGASGITYHGNGTVTTNDATGASTIEKK